MKQQETDWFRQLWRRLLVTGIVAAWVVMEWFVWHDELFRWLTLAALAYAIWNFFLFFDSTPKTPAAPKPDDGEPPTQP